MILKRTIIFTSPKHLHCPPKPTHLTTQKLVCSHYDATLRKSIEIPPLVVNEMKVLVLEKRMSAISGIMNDLEALGVTDEGVALSALLKYKYWMEPALQNLVPDLFSLKSKYELTQRFYIIKGEGITASEAYRFLNNRWMERQLYAANRAVRKNEGEQAGSKPITKGISDKKKRKPLINKISDK